MPILRRERSPGRFRGVRFFGILKNLEMALEQTCTWKFKYLTYVRYLKISSGRYSTYLGEKNMGGERVNKTFRQNIFFGYIDVGDNFEILVTDLTC